jgi:medium-chain acyl-[acyl-carrier-protein] hydrolase
MPEQKGVSKVTVPENSASRPWITNAELAPNAHMRLFCLPYAGGGASVFRTWKTAFPMTIQVCPIQLPGRENRLRERPFQHLSPLLTALAQEILFFLEKPFALFGYSMGALIAFELARYLRRISTIHLVHLFVAGFDAPHITRTHKPVHTLSEPDLIEKLRALKGTPEEVLAHDELMRLLLPTLRADFALCETYTYYDEPPLDCPLTVFGGLEDENTSPAHLRAWKKHTTRTCTVHMLPGSHFFLYENRNTILDIIIFNLNVSLAETGMLWSNSQRPLLRKESS